MITTQSNNNDEVPKSRHEKDYELIIQNRHLSRFHEAAAKSLNVLVPFTIYPQMNWTAEAMKLLHHSVRRALQIFVMENRKQLVYNREVHQDIDVLSYMINRSDKTEEEKDLLGHANFVRMSLCSDDFIVKVRRGLLHYTRNEIEREEKLVTIDPQTRMTNNEKPIDTLKIELVGARKELVPIGPSMLLFQSASELNVTEIKDIHRNDQDSYDPVAIVQAISYVSNYDILYMDTEYEREQEDNEWRRDTYELAIINNNSDVLYSADDSEGVERKEVLAILDSRVELVKGVAAELDYVYGVHDEMRTTKGHAAYLAKAMKKKMNCIMIDLELFGVPKYDQPTHSSLLEIQYFRQHFLPRYEVFKDQYRNIKDPYERRRIDIMIYRFLYMMVQKNIDGAYVAFSDYHQSLFNYKDMLGPIKQYSYEDVSTFDYQIVLWKAYYETKYYYFDMPCYFHNSKKCRQCSYHRFRLDIAKNGEYEITARVEKYLTLYNNKYQGWAGANYYDLMPTVNSPYRSERFIEYSKSILFEDEWKSMLLQNSQVELPVGED